MTEPVEAEPQDLRLEALRSFDPLLEDWYAQGTLTDGEADLVILAAEASERRQPLRLTQPGGSTQLAAALAAHTAVRQLTQPGRYPAGPTVLIAGARVRAIVQELSVGGDSIAAHLGAVRLRADGRVQLLAGSRHDALTDDLRLVLVTPRSHWPAIGIRLGVAVLDELSLGDAYDGAHSWAVQNAELVHVVAPLDPGMSPVSHEVTWPQVALDGARWGRSHSWPLVGDVIVDHAGPGPTGLDDARRRIAAAPMDRQWPAQLVAAAGLSRALAGLSAPMALYDVHTARSIAVPFADRMEAIKDTGPSDLPDGWESFAATDWAPMKRRLLEAAEAVEEFNPKAELVGTTVEQLLAGGHQVDVWLDSEVHSRALQEHLLTGGFAILAEHVDGGALAVRPFREARRPLSEPRVAVLAGLPASWQLPALLSGAVAGPLHVVAYDFEAVRVPAFFGWMLNSANRQRHSERQQVVRRTLGPGVAEAPTPAPLQLNITTRTTDQPDIATPVERVTDAAEFAALADDAWLSMAIQAREQPGSDEPGVLRPATALLVEPGPAVLVVATTAVLDRLVGGRIRPTPVAALLPGMQLLTATRATGGVFAAIRPRLDHARGVGTQFWLGQWDEALHTALLATGSPAAMAAALETRGASISTAAVASWPSPYRIGPRDPANVKRVAEMAAHRLVRHHHQRIHAVMRGVRVEHALLGRQLAAAVRAHLNGDVSAFDNLEDRYGADIESLFGDPAVHVVIRHLADGHAPRTALGRTHSVASAQKIFQPQETQ